MLGIDLIYLGVDLVDLFMDLQGAMFLRKADGPVNSNRKKTTAAGVWGPLGPAARRQRPTEY